MTHLSEARQQLYDAIENWEFGKDANMSRLPWKHGYTAGETIGVDPQEFSVSRVGYLSEVAVTYKTADGKLKTERELVVPRYERNKFGELVDMASIEKTEEMLSRRSITYPD